MKYYIYIYIYMYKDLLCTYLPSWTRDLCEKLVVAQLVKKFPAFHGTRRFITVFVRIRHGILS
jgi:hypothetical protein